MLFSFGFQRESLVFAKCIPWIFPGALRAPGCWGAHNLDVGGGGKKYQGPCTGGGVRASIKKMEKSNSAFGKSKRKGS